MKRFILALSFGVVFALIVSPSAHAQTTSALTLDPWTDGQFGETLDTPFYEEQGHLKDGPGDAQLFVWDSFGRFRFSTHDPDAFSLGYRYLTVNLDTNSPVLPDTLDEISLAGGVHLGEMMGGRVSLVFGAGYSGDNLFADNNGIFGIGHVIYERPLNATDVLVFSIDYDGNSDLFPDVPLPGFQYVHRDANVSFGVGFPSSFLHIALNDRVSIDASYMVPYSGEATVAYDLGKGFSVFSKYTSSFNAFQQDEHEKTDRIFMSMQRIEAGVRYTTPDIWHGIALDAALVVGYAFDQTFSTGFDVRDLDHLAEVSDEPYIGIILRGTF